MNEDRHRARERQRAAGNDPEGTRPDVEVRFDHQGPYRTGHRYREWLENRIREENDDT